MGYKIAVYITPEQMESVKHCCTSLYFNCALVSLWIPSGEPYVELESPLYGAFGFYGNFKRTFMARSKHALVYNMHNIALTDEPCQLAFSWYEINNSSIETPRTIYKPGNLVAADDLDTNGAHLCSNGINFFTTKANALYAYSSLMFHAIDIEKVRKLYRWTLEVL